MIPQTAGAVLAFLGLVAPGALFHISREKRIPERELSAFREATAVALASLGLTVAALVILALLRLVVPTLIADPQQWFKDGGRYVSANFYLASTSLILVVAASCGLALLANYIARQRGASEARADLEHGNIWYMAIRRGRTTGTNPWAHVMLTSGNSFLGYVQNYSAQLNDSPRGLQLVGPELLYRPAPSDSGYQPPDRELQNWSSVVIDRKDIEYIKIKHYSAAEANK